MVMNRQMFVPSQSIMLAMILSVLGASSGLAGGEDVNSLVEQLNSPSPYLRLTAAGKLAELGPSAADAAPALIEAFACERIDVLFETPDIAGSRQRFADALIRIGDSVIPKLEQAMKHENGLLRIWSAQTLYRLDRKQQRAKVLSVLTDGLLQNSEVAGDAAMILEQMGEDAVPAIPKLIEQMMHQELAVRCNAALALSTIAKADPDQNLLEALRHSSSLVRVGAAFALQHDSSELSAAVRSVLAAALQDGSSTVRRQAVWAIGHTGVAAQPLAKELILALPNIDPELSDYFFGTGSLGRYSTDPSMALAAIGPAAQQDLINALESDHSRTRVMAAVALLRIDRSHASRVAPFLEAAREDPDRNIQTLAAMNSLPNPTVDGQNMDGLIRAVLASTDFGPPSPAAFQLIQRGAEAVAPLMEVLKGGDGLAATRVSGVLARIGEPALPALTEALQSENDQLRVFAARALAEMGKAAQPQLISALKDKLYPVRRAARSGLKSIGTPEALSALQKTAGNQ